MYEFPETRDSLLVRIHDADDRIAWDEFAAIYRPMIYRMARRRGFQDADAHDLAQKVLMSVAANITDWEPDPERGRFRTWLARVTQNAMIDVQRRVRLDAARGGTSVLGELEQQLASEPPSEEEFRREHRRAVFRAAAAQIRHEFEDATWQAFWLTAVDGESASDVADKLGKSVGAVYTARSRVMRRLKAMVHEHEW